MKSDVIVRVEAQDSDELGGKIRFIQTYAALGREPEPEPDPEQEPPVVPTPPPERRPWFQIGKGVGKPGDIVEVPVYGGCSYSTNGFQVGGGSGTLGVGSTWDVALNSVTLSPFLREYLPGSAYFAYNFAGVAEGAIPEAWWDCAVGFWSLDGTSASPAIPIPSGTELIRILLQIDRRAVPGVRTLTCKDQHYYTHDKRRRRDLEYTNAMGLPYTSVECLPGELTILQP